MPLAAQPAEYSGQPNAEFVEDLPQRQIGIPARCFKRRYRVGHEKSSAVTLALLIASTFGQPELADRARLNYLPGRSYHVQYYVVNGRGSFSREPSP